MRRCWRRPISTSIARVEIATGGVADLRAAAVFLPTQQNQAWRIQLRSPDSEALTTVMVDDRSGALTKVTPQSGDKIAQWIRWIHEGSHSGLIWQILVFLCGVLPTVFAITGTMIWLRSRSAKAAAGAQLSGSRRWMRRSNELGLLAASQCNIITSTLDDGRQRAAGQAKCRNTAWFSTRCYRPRPAALLLGMVTAAVIAVAAFAQAPASRTAPRHRSRPLRFAAPPPAADTAQSPTALPAAPSAPSVIAAAVLPRDLSPWGMFLNADIVVKVVMVGLVFASLVTWTVWLAKSLGIVEGDAQRTRSARGAQRSALARGGERAPWRQQRDGGAAAAHGRPRSADFAASRSRKP